MSLTLKTAALAGALLLASAGGALAAPYAFVDHHAFVRAFHSNGAPVVNNVDYGDHVKIIGHWGNWYKIQIPGPDGWVRANALDFTPGPGPGPGPGACFWGPYGYICIHP